MSESYGTSAPSTTTPDASGTVETAKHEAGALKDTATDQAKDVAGTLKDEASAVVGEAKTQAKDLYKLTQSELKEQAQTQQQRVALGLRAVSDELGSMAGSSEQDGLAADVVRQVSDRLSGAATWLGDRDPGSVLTEVKNYARRKPGTFILAAAVAGVVVGRLTRALASNAADDKADEASSGGTEPSAGFSNPTPPSVVGAPASVAAEQTPIFEQASPALTDRGAEAGYGRSDTL